MLQTRGWRGPQTTPRATIRENIEVLPVGSDAKTRAVARMAERIESESKRLPCRWGYFQGAVLIPWSLLLLFGAIWALRQSNYEPTYISATVLLIGLIGFPLGIGLLLRKKFALVLVYVTVGLTLLLVAIKIPVAIRHFQDPGENGSGFPEAEMLFVWLFSMLYYRKRRTQFH